MQRDLTACGFEGRQGGLYFGDHTVDAVKRVTVVQRWAPKDPWFKPSVRDIHMLRIEENNDLASALDVSEDD